MTWPEIVLVAAAAAFVAAHFYVWWRYRKTPVDPTDPSRWAEWDRSADPPDRSDVYHTPKPVALRWERRAPR